MSENQELKGEGLVDQVTGKVKETAGKLTGDKSTEVEGKFDQLKGKTKEEIAEVKDKLDRALSDN